MVDASRIFTSSVGFIVLTACTPQDLPRADADNRLAELDAMVQAATFDVDAGDHREALHELMTAADLAHAAALDDALRCAFAGDSVEIAEALASRGAYPESRMAYAVAVSFADSCSVDFRDELRLRREDVRATQRWSEGPAAEVARLGVTPIPAG